MFKLLPFSLIFVFFSIISVDAVSISSKPDVLKSFNPKSTDETARRCSYTVVIKTSCSSPSYTQDRISLVFGDSYGNEVYLKRLDDPYSGTFERCSTDKFQITGPCTHDVCYLYMLRQGSDGWKPESVKIYGPHIRPVTFHYNIFLPNAEWYGFNECPRLSLPTNT